MSERLPTGPGPEDLMASLSSRASFVAAVRAAATERRGFAAGKIGWSEQQLLLQPLLASVALSPRQRRAAHLVLREHALRRSGVFPDTPQVFGEYAALFAARIGELDYLGLFLHEVARGFEGLLLERHRWACRRMFYRDQEPDRSVPDDPASCYLEAFRGRRLLLVCPFAGFLATRARAEVFEAVWAASGKRWFHPSHVEAIEFPYGFQSATRGRYPSIFELLAELEHRVERSSADVVLIAAGALGIPLAVAARRRGKLAIALGGHLQVLFGVLGRRWRCDAAFRRTYVNEHWVELPERYRPAAHEHGEGAYW